VLEVERGVVLTYNQRGQQQVDGCEVPLVPVWEWLLDPEAAGDQGA